MRSMLFWLSLVVTPWLWGAEEEKAAVGIDIISVELSRAATWNPVPFPTDQDSVEFQFIFPPSHEGEVNRSPLTANIHVKWGLGESPAEEVLGFSFKPYQVIDLMGVIKVSHFPADYFCHIRVTRKSDHELAVDVFSPGIERKFSLYKGTDIAMPRQVFFTISPGEESIEQKRFLRRMEQTTHHWMETRVWGVAKGTAYVFNHEHHIFLTERTPSVKVSNPSYGYAGPVQLKVSMGKDWRDLESRFE